MNFHDFDEVIFVDDYEELSFLKWIIPTYKSQWYTYMKMSEAKPIDWETARYNNHVFNFHLTERNGRGRDYNSSMGTLRYVLYV